MKKLLSLWFLSRKKGRNIETTGELSDDEEI